MQEIRATFDHVYAWLITLYTSSELKIMVIASAFGAFFSVAVGGVDQQVMTLIGFVIADYVTGWGVAIKKKNVHYDIGLKGVFKKIAIFAAVAFTHWLDVGMGIKILRSMALFSFVALEATSVIKNIDLLGYGQYIPDFIRDKLAQIKEEKGIKL